MLLTLLSLPDNWHLTIAGLCKILPDGKEKISKTLNSLIDKGYVTREQGRGNNGQFDSTNMEVHECPIISTDQDPNSEYKEKEAQEITEFSPYPEKPDTVNQDTESPYAEKLPQYINKKSNNDLSNNHKECKADTLTDSGYEDLIDEFGIENVDYQIDRIKHNHYKGCLNYATIKAWCKERLDRQDLNYSSKPNNRLKKNSFCNFQQRQYDFDELEESVLCN
ncbi:MAG: helix-turn-helix domain-containing protein [Lachnospiraceae bacterium]|nr:helix-turn-helix domain-containing protein [Lachnospiraceae bacterium]